MELGSRSDLNSFIGDADNLNRGLYRTLSPFHIYVFGRISLIFEKFYPFIYLNKYITVKFQLSILCSEERKALVFRFHPLLMCQALSVCKISAF